MSKSEVTKIHVTRCVMIEFRIQDLGVRLLHLLHSPFPYSTSLLSVILQKNYQSNYWRLAGEMLPVEILKIRKFFLQVFVKFVVFFCTINEIICTFQLE